MQQVTVLVNGESHTLDVQPGELLRTALRRLRYFSVKHGDETGESGADAVLLTFTPEEPRSYRLVNSGVMLAAQADGAAIITVEGLSGPRDTQLHPLQEQFIARGAIQCGYCTPAQLLAAKRLLDETPNPAEAQVREAIAGVLCRCTGYAKPVEAILAAAAQLRGEEPPPQELQVIDDFEAGEWPTGGEQDDPGGPGMEPGGVQTATRTRTAPAQIASPKTAVVNKPEQKVDAVKLSKGRAVFADDMEMPGMLYGGLLTSPRTCPHCSIDASASAAGRMPSSRTRRAARHLRQRRAELPEPAPV